MKKIYTTLLLTLSLITCQVANAYQCQGKVTNLTMSPDGQLMLSYGSITWVRVCNVSTTFNGVTPEACKSIQSLLMAAKMGDREVQFYFNDASGDCTKTAHPEWQALQNWYFGPVLL